MQNMFNTCQSRILERAASKQDLQLLVDTVKSLLNVSQQNQQLMRQAEYQRTQLIRRVTTLETRVAQLEQIIQNYRDVMNRFATIPQRIVISSSARGQAHEPAEQYVYRPA